MSQPQPFPAPSQDPNTWTPQDAAALYGVDAWGQGFFAVTPDGRLTVRPTKDPAREIDLLEVVEGMRERGFTTPILLRFSDLLQHRLKEIRDAFDRVMSEVGYRGGYRCVYPIKVNQQRHVCEELARFGQELGFGLEAGSKPELLAVLGLTAGRPEMPIVCNGFKDEEFIETVILAAKLGRNITPVVEKPSELGLLVGAARKYGVRPQIGIRVKLAARGAGKWEASGGSRSKFGLFVSEVLQALELLQRENMADCLTMLHCHIGSQVHDIHHLEDAANEIARVYCELHRLGAGLRALDVGGGLGVDYDGSQTNWESSTNYRLEEYAAAVVGKVQAACDQAGVPHPEILSESGRAMVSYSSVLVCNVLGSSSFDAGMTLEEIEAGARADGDDAPQPLRELLEVRRELAAGKLRWAFHKASAARDQAQSLFNLGYLSLTDRSACDELYWRICRRLWELAQEEEEIPEELQPLGSTLSDIYFCNFSLFQSLPDAWAIRQVFPVCPIHRLDERPTRLGVLADITCDSDGQIGQFPDKRQNEVKQVLELHPLRPEEPYYLGFFLVGAYQEILGDLHNLLGDTHTVHVRLDEDGDWEVEEVVRGDSVRQVLQYVNFRPEVLEEALRREVEKAMRRQRLTLREGRSLLHFFREGLEGYTYLEEAEPEVPEAPSAPAIVEPEPASAHPTEP
ncbi:MAG: biosynthetic arginine decarboxylase [Planctomycetota bacterium]|nr:MAG: biosynthetic arginine decarboxylase [Planctomycetota bacterium]